MVSVQVESPSPVLPPVPVKDPFKIAVVVMAIIVAILLILAAYATQRMGGVDEIGLVNPAYMALHFEKITYPVHGYYNSMVVHPPVHYEIIAYLMRFGMSLYYAEATPALVMLLLCLVLIVHSPFPGPVKIGFLYGIWVSVAMFGKIGQEMFGMRPENHIGAAWLAGLIALESGRLENWSVKKLFFGAFLLTYAAGLHYYAIPGLLGTVVYMAWSVLELGLPGSRRALLAIAGGGLLFGIPYLLLFVGPNLADVYGMVRGTQTGGGGVVVESIRAHMQEYQYWLSGDLGNFWIRVPIALHVPLLVISTAVFLALPCTRGIALAALPLEGFLLLFAWHKDETYLIHEIALYSAATAAAGLTIAQRLVPRLPSTTLRAGAWAGLVLALGVGWWQLGKWSFGSPISLRPMVHESEIARAAGREILGPDAKVAGRIGTWYASGARTWHDPLWDLISPSTVPEEFEANYFNRFDAVCEYSHMSDSASNHRHKALLSYYLDGTLTLRGFFFAEQNIALKYLLLSKNRPASVVGFAMKGSELFRFAEDAAGDYEMVVLATPVSNEAARFCQRVPYYNVMLLPKARDADPQLEIVSALVPSDGPRAYASELPSSRVVQSFRGKLSAVDGAALIAKLRREDLPIHFEARFEDVPAPAAAESH